MIEVTCPSARFNTHRDLYERYGDKMDFIMLTISDDGHKFQKEITVSEAVKLAKDLMEWVMEFKGGEVEEDE